MKATTVIFNCLAIVWAVIGIAHLAAGKNSDLDTIKMLLCALLAQSTIEKNVRHMAEKERKE